ncbi:MAG: D-glycerate dehydrogenase [Sphingomonadales bacterium]|nr:D-glycerate dehydrogenase [Sphingomonadales bacterium]NCO47514.1 D-glycerate dehydrogenase [Sphingomonadales bacterium]NCP01509.1 D-glycerate dehydrogenase [Sphingomonadales bacterium]NCP26719.1 D-glycerate dehydrogenase [Sphingomonadales bacterium]NCP44085.1 D-glycerate dehydrogenase [Sphingomonadales bacterium]
MPDSPAPSNPRVIITRELADTNQDRMCELFDALPNYADTPFSRDELIAAMADCDVLVPTVTDHIDAEMIENAPDRLRLIASFGAGVDHIDLAAARAKKIMVTNTPGVFTEDTADMTMALILSTPRRLSEGEKLMRSGQWEGWKPSGMLGHCIGGKKLGIIGMGRIGQAVARRASGFGLSIFYHNRRQLPPAVEESLRASFLPDLDELIRECDIISLHCPHTVETHEMINAERIGKMKSSAYLINTARGDLVDEDALIQALQSEKIGGAGLDVYQNEPDIDPRFLTLKNTVLLPHMGSATFEGREASGERVITNIRVWADGHRPPDQVLDGWV